jgi:hypothetical protein
LLEVQWFEKISDDCCLMNFSSVHESEHFPKLNHFPEFSNWRVRETMSTREQQQQTKEKE